MGRIFIFCVRWQDGEVVFCIRGYRLCFCICTTAPLVHSAGNWSPCLTLLRIFVNGLAIHLRMVFYTSPVFHLVRAICLLVLLLRSLLLVLCSLLVAILVSCGVR